MGLALLIALVAVGLGAAVAFVPGLGPRTLGPIRTFSLVAAVAAVAAHLLPEAIEEAGAIALAGFAAGLVIPALSERLLGHGAHAHHHESHGLAFEIGYAGLLVHSLGDGIALWTFARPGEVETDVVIALAAHMIPMTTVVVLHVATTRGVPAAAWRALGIALATVAGVLGGALVPGELFHEVEPWVSAVVAGLLLHVIAHDLDADSPTTALMRTFDLLAAVTAIVLVVGVQASLQSPVFLHLASLGLTIAPPLLGGLVASALLHALWGRVSTRWARSGPPLAEVLRGLAVAARSPLSALEVLPPARSLIVRGAPAPFVLAFALAAPALGLETLALTVVLLGAPLALARLAGAVLTSAITAWFAGRLAVARIRPSLEAPAPEPRNDPGYAAERGHQHLLGEHEHDEPLWAQVLEILDDLVHHASPWLVTGLILAAISAVEIPPGGLGALGAAGSLVLFAIALPAYFSAAAATPLAAIAILLGAAPGAVIAALIAGPAIHVAKLRLLSRAYGARAAAAVAAGVIAIAAAAGALVPMLGAQTITPIVPATAGWPALVCAAVLVGLALRSLWRSGVRRWLAALLFGRTTGDPHAHAPH